MHAVRSHAQAQRKTIIRRVLQSSRLFSKVTWSSDRMLESDVSCTHMGMPQLMLPDEQAPSLKSNVLARSHKHDKYDAYVAMLAAAVISQKWSLSSYCQGEIAKHYMQFECTAMPVIRWFDTL